MKKLSKIGMCIALIGMLSTNINMKYGDEILPSCLLFILGLALYFAAE
jgi:hypothetical protein